MRVISVGLVLAYILAVSAPAHAARSAQAPDAAGCPTAACVFLPIVRQPGLTARVLIDDSGWVRGVSQYDYSSCYGVGGTIRSALPQPLYDIVLEARFFDQAGQLLAVLPGHTLLHTTLAQAPNAFYIDATQSVCSSNPSPPYTSVTFELSVTSVSSRPAPSYLPITIVDFQVCSPSFSEAPNPGTITVRNDNRVAVSSVHLTIKQNDYRYYRAAVVGELAPGKSATYTPYCDDLGRGNAIAAIGAEGVAVP